MPLQLFAFTQATWSSTSTLPSNTTWTWILRLWSCWSRFSWRFLLSSRRLSSLLLRATQHALVITVRNREFCLSYIGCIYHRRHLLGLLLEQSGMRNTLDSLYQSCRLFAYLAVKGNTSNQKKPNFIKRGKSTYTKVTMILPLPSLFGWLFGAVTSTSLRHRQTGELCFCSSSYILIWLWI